MALILEPERWNEADLTRLAELQRAGLQQLLGVFSTGVVPFPSPVAGETAIELLRAVTALRGTAGEGTPSERLSALVNAQYATLLAVSLLVPSTLVQDRAAEKRRNS